ncbi:MAG: hypothetical protein C0171_04360 [Caldisphaera sp.]|jgi:hypothetical protein|uniref:SRPBCC family protein n=1 Tax=Caldisphaera sp. TaxID=2060322 RepID=UPI000CB20EDD|nr:MAG: hypothetical protein C0201_03635 [Caldisphaera sp.]PMP90793.1 MAG: hypothetical protein C0171_04360 [Caldisphaera sp.]
MTYFKLEKEFKGDEEKVWKIISNIPDIPKYWHGHREINIVKNDKKSIEALVKFVFPSVAKVRYEINYEKKEVVAYYLDGPFKGISKLRIDNNKLINEWDIRFSGLFKLISHWETNHFKKGSEDALNRILNNI